MPGIYLIDRSYPTTLVALRSGWGKIFYHTRGELLSRVCLGQSVFREHFQGSIQPLCSCRLERASELPPDDCRIGSVLKEKLDVLGTMISRCLQRSPVLSAGCVYVRTLVDQEPNGC